MRTVEFRRFFDNDNALRVRFDVDHGEVLSFVVQLESWIDSKWIATVRYDTAHGFAHRDKMHSRKETEKVEIPVRNYKEGLNFAIDDMVANWRDYRRRYEE